MRGSANGRRVYAGAIAVTVAVILCVLFRMYYLPWGAAVRGIVLGMLTALARSHCRALPADGRVAAGTDMAAAAAAAADCGTASIRIACDAWVSRPEGCCEASFLRSACIDYFGAGAAASASL